MVFCVAVGLRSAERRADVSSFGHLRQSVTEIYISISATELPRAKVGMT
jgi:hypothetical protein